MCISLSLRYLQAMGLNDFDADEVALGIAELGKLCFLYSISANVVV